MKSPLLSARWPRSAAIALLCVVLSGVSGPSACGQTQPPSPQPPAAQPLVKLGPIPAAAQFDSSGHLNVDAATRAYLAFRGETDQSRSLELIHRYEARYERQYHHIFRTFLKLRNTQIPLEPTNPLNPEAEFSK